MQILPTFTLKKPIATLLVAACIALTGLGLARPAQAQSGASAALSLLPVASVLATVSAGAGATSAMVALPAALSVGGAVLTVIAVQASADGTVYLLERTSDGARASIRVSGRVGQGASQAIGTTITVSVIASGVLLSAAGDVLAFLPNALGRALLHDERLT